MSYLLDTNILIWCLENNSKKLNQEVIKVINDPNNIIYISSVSTWEIAIKTSIGKLRTDKDILPLIKNLDYKFLNIIPEVTLKTLELPSIHNDPFDRLLIAQANYHKLKLITSDKIIVKYPGQCLLNK